jgi:hypothetical protein
MSILEEVYSKDGTLAGYACFGVYVPKDEYHSERSVVNLCPLSETYNHVDMVQQLLHTIDERTRASNAALEAETHGHAVAGTDEDVKKTCGDKEGRVP